MQTRSKIPFQQSMITNEGIWGREMRYWKITPGQNGFLWVEQRDHDCIALGWSETGDLNKYKSEKQSYEDSINSIEV